MKRVHLIKTSVMVGLLSLPSMVVYGQNLDWFEDAVKALGGLLEDLIPVLVAIALVVFIWGLVVFIHNSGNEQARDVGKQRMVWGIIALFVMVSVWGFVKILQALVGTTGVTTITPPAIL